jgi:hypothetical protein
MQRLRLTLISQVWKLARKRLEDLEEDVLRQVFRLIVLADELVGDVEDLPPVQPDDLLPGVLIARQTPFDQLVDGGRLRGLVL